MTGLVRKATLVSVVGLMVAGAAWSSPPSVANSTRPEFILATGYSDALGPDPLGNVLYVIRDANNVPEANAEIVLDFTACTDVRLSQNINGNGGVTSCTGKRITGTTDGLGVLTLSVVAGGYGTGVPRALRDCVAVTVNGVPFPSMLVAAADRDGVSGVASGDLTLIIYDMVNNDAAGRSNLDNSMDFPEVNSGDLSILIGVFVRGNSALSGSPYCP